MAGGVVIPGNRVRIKGRKASVARFFIISVAYTVVWIALSSQLGHYRAEYGPQILLQLSVAYYLPSIPVLLLAPNVEKLLDMCVGNCRSMQYRLLFGLAGCAIIAALYPFMHHQLLLMLCAVMVLGMSSAIAFSTSYQLVGWFRAADTIALGIGCVGSGPIVLFLQVALGLKVRPLPWQWIVMFQACAAIAVLGMVSTMSLFWQYGDIISGRVPYIEKPLLMPEGEEEEDDEDDEFDEQGNQHARMMSRMLSMADPFQGMPLHFAGYVDEGYARMLRAHGLVRRVASADSDLGFLRITAPTSGLDYSVLSRLPMKGPVPYDPEAPGSDIDSQCQVQRTEASSFVDSVAATAGWKGRASITSQLLAESEAAFSRRVHSHQSLSGFDDLGGPLDEPSGSSENLPFRHSETSHAHNPAAVGRECRLAVESKFEDEAPVEFPTSPQRVKPLRIPEHDHKSAPATFLSGGVLQSPPWGRDDLAERLGQLEVQHEGVDTRRVAFQDDVEQGGEGSDRMQVEECLIPDVLNSTEKGERYSHTLMTPSGANPEPVQEVAPKEEALHRTWEAFKELWMLVVWTLASSIIVNLVFPFFTYLPATGRFGEYLPQVLFYVRIMADICGRFLPRLKGPFAVTSVSSIVTLSAVMCGIVSTFFILLHNRCGNDWVWLCIVIFLWFAGGFVNTSSFTLAPNMVDSSLAGQASALMALTYQVAHFMGLVLAAVVAFVMFGDITGEGG